MFLNHFIKTAQKQQHYSYTSSKSQEVMLEKFT